MFADTSTAGVLRSAGTGRRGQTRKYRHIADIWGTVVIFPLKSWISSEDTNKEKKNQQADLTLFTKKLFSFNSTPTSSLKGVFLLVWLK